MNVFCTSYLGSITFEVVQLMTAKVYACLHLYDPFPIAPFVFGMEGEHYVATDGFPAVCLAVKHGELEGPNNDDTVR